MPLFSTEHGWARGMVFPEPAGYVRVSPSPLDSKSGFRTVCSTQIHMSVAFSVESHALVRTLQMMQVVDREIRE